MKTPTLHHRKISNTNAMPPKIRVGGMQRQTKPAQVKKVAPPTVPDSPSNRKSSGSCSSGYSSGSCSSANLECTSFTNTGTNDNYPSSPCINRPNIKDSIHQGSLLADNGNVGESSLSSAHTYTAFHYPPQQSYTHIVSRNIGSQPGSPMHQEPSVLIQEHTTMYERFPPSFQAQISLEDQGIDLQSPGRDSPGSSGSSGSGSGLGGSGCRNSTSSLDSGRASSSAYDGKTCHTYIQTQHRLSSHSYESAGSLRHSYHSSSSSLGSMEEPQVVQVNVHDLLAAGYPDQDVLNRWLNDLHFEEYYHLFVQAGYDMPTISRMTPEDLTAVGITKPGHRKKLKSEIARLNISDGLPLYIPNSITEWLHLLHLEEYEGTLHQQGYHTVEQVTDIAWEDLEEIGIKKLGHQKKMMLAIKRVKDILSGVRRFSVDQHDSMQQVKMVKDNIPMYNYPLQEVAITTTKAVTSPFSAECYNQPELRTFQQTQYMPQTTEAFHCDNLNTGQLIHGIPPDRAIINSPLHSYRTLGHVKGTSSPSHMLYRPDMVAVHIRHPSGARSLENLESNRDTMKNTTAVNANEHRYYDGMLTWRRGSVDDGEVTPTNETMIMCEMEGGGTLPRPKVSVKPRPVAKIVAKSRRVITDATIDSPYIEQNYECNPSPEKDKYPEIISYGSPRKDVGSLYGTIGRTKKTPPPPPKRTNSIKSEKNSEKIVEKSIEDNPEQVFANCIKSLATKFSISQDENIPSSPSKGTIEVTPDINEFPSLTESVLQQVDSVSCTVHKSSTHESTELLAETLLQHSDSDTELPLHPKRNDSNSSFDSSSSTDSNSLPFANENVGTIKQRAIKQHPPLSVMEMPRSQRSSPVIQSRVAHPVANQSSAVVEHQYEMRSSEIDDDYDDVAEDESVLDEIRRLGRPQDTGDVLNDIGNMLADLTDELDAMLESELQPPQ